MKGIGDEISGWHYGTRQPIRLRWDGQTISEMEPIDDAPQDCWIAPPLVDLQINGYGGIDFQQDGLTMDDLLLATRKLRAAGCGLYFFTLITDDWPKLMSRLRNARQLRSQSVELRDSIAGWHLEGPFLSSEPGFCGAHNPEVMTDPTTAEIEKVRAITEDDPVLLTLAPERPGAIAAIARAVALGMKVSVGHTNASAEALANAQAAGATGFTHLGNACPQQLDRHDNILWRVLDFGQFKISLIADGIHVSPALFRIVHRAVPSDRIYYTTD